MGTAAEDAHAEPIKDAHAEPGDEARHDPSDDPRWVEVNELEFWTDDARCGGYVRFELRPRDGTCWFWTALTGTERSLVTVLEFDAELPRWPGLELRGPSLWAELIVETPWEHVSLGMESFAVELERPEDVFEGCRGDLVPLGYDLEWESDGKPPRPVGSGYSLDAVAHGEILVGADVIDFEGSGRRSHSWGVPRIDLAPRPAEDRPVAPVELPSGLRRGWVLDGSGPYWADLSR
jgi:hypothetical protein